MHCIMTAKSKWMQSQLSLGDDHFKTELKLKKLKLKNSKCVIINPNVDIFAFVVDH